MTTHKYETTRAEIILQFYEKEKLSYVVQTYRNLISLLKDIKIAYAKNKFDKTKKRPSSNAVKEYRADLKTLSYYSDSGYVVITLKGHKYRGFSYTFEQEHMSELKHQDFKRFINETIKFFRMSEKPVASTAVFGGSPVKVSGPIKKGRVFVKPGQIYEVYVQKNLKTLYNPKSPLEKNRHIGIELEFCAPIDEHDFSLKLVKSGLHKFAQLKKDGSLRPKNNETGFELAILLKQDNFKKPLKRITDLLTSIGAVANDRRCGMHVHIDMRNRNKDLVYNNLVACQSALLKLVSPSRRDNEFCRLVKSKKFPTTFTGDRQERYRTINAASYYKYNTLEVRMHEGTVKYDQITNWIEVLLKIANLQKKINGSVFNLTSLQRRIKVNKRLTNYMTDRSCYWQVNGETITHAMNDALAPIPDPPRTGAGAFLTMNVLNDTLLRRRN